MQLFSSAPNRNASAVAIPQEFPVYRIAGNGFYGVNDNGYDTLFQPGEIIAYDDEPNQDMEPLNALAIERMREFLTKLDSLGREQAKLEKKAFVSALDAFERVYASTQKLGGNRARSLTSANPTILGNGKRDAAKATKVDMPESFDEPVVQVAGSLAQESERTTANESTNKNPYGKNGKVNG